MFYHSFGIAVRAMVRVESVLSVRAGLEFVSGHDYETGLGLEVEFELVL